ncbi:hypothetical protein HOLleu_25891 [Holothuria leucospilota]|uniref:Uncharacterized protein n=1 Tax=Holothuria leucospilota TaxID=206669 RepID=A0A9Q1BTA3_HOLLE|nr:hypothetical protein HOLleu_25891 [Holothuria leucospilota]
MEMESLSDYLEESSNAIDKEIRSVGVQMSNTIFVPTPNASYYTIGLSSLGDDCLDNEANDFDDNVEKNNVGGREDTSPLPVQDCTSSTPLSLSLLRRLLPLQGRSFGMKKTLKPSQI